LSYGWQASVSFPDRLTLEGRLLRVVPVADLLPKYGVSKATFFKWRSKYGGACRLVRLLVIQARFDFSCPEAASSALASRFSSLRFIEIRHRLQRAVSTTSP